MPIVEALACGCPVVASAHRSLDEASGDAALRADPDDPAAIAAAIERALAERDASFRPGWSTRRGSPGARRRDSPARYEEALA